MLCMLVVTLKSSLHSLIQSLIQLLLGSYNQFSECRWSHRTRWSCQQCDCYPFCNRWSIDVTAVRSINLTTEPLIGGSIAIIRSVIFRSIRLTSLLCTIDDTTLLMILPFDWCCSYNLWSHINFTVAPSFETSMAHSDPSSSTIIPSSIVEPCCWTYLH